MQTEIASEPLLKALTVKLKALQTVPMMPRAIASRRFKMTVKTMSLFKRILILKTVIYSSDVTSMKVVMKPY